MQIIENQWKSWKIHENQWKSKKISENQCKSVKIMFRFQNTQSTFRRFGDVVEPHFVLDCFLDTVLGCVVFDFSDFGYQKGLQNALLLLPGTRQNLTPATRSSQRDPEPCPWAPKSDHRSQNVTKSDPKVTILVPKVIEMGREFCCFRSLTHSTTT